MKELLPIIWEAEHIQVIYPFRRTHVSFMPSIHCIGVIGAGAWGTALAKHLAEKGLRHFTVFAEGKFNHARFNFSETPPGSSFNLFGFNSTYNMFHVAFGLSYNF